MPFEAPPYVGILSWSPARCDNRVAFSPKYTNHCSNNTNNPPCVALPFRDRWILKDCQMNDQLHGPHFQVCGYCRDHIKYERWMQRALTRIGDYPPDNETADYPGFLTRMCRLCQEREQLLVRGRWGAAGGLVLPPMPANTNEMNDFPTNTCTCKWHLRRGVFCLEHRKSIVQQAMEALTATRNVTLAFLQDSALNQATGVTHRTLRERRVGREDACLYRACRCGRDPVPMAQATVFQCMACEGVVLKREEPVLESRLNMTEHTVNSQSANAAAFFSPRRPRDPRQI